MNFFEANSQTVIPENRLPRLVVLTGLNGSGKTRGLKRLQEANPDGTTYIDYRNFTARWDASTYASSNPQGEVILMQTLFDWKCSTIVGTMGFSLRSLSFVSDDQAMINWMKTNRTEANFARLAWPFFELFPEALASDFNTHARLLSEYPDKATNYWDGFGNDPVAVAYKDACKHSGTPVHCIADEAVIQSLDRLQRLKHPLQFDLASLVIDYAEKRNKVYYEASVNNTNATLLSETFHQGNPNPLDHINTILKSLSDDKTNVFRFEVQSNVPAQPPTYEELKNQSPFIEIKLRDITSGAFREFAELSSGEQTLLALSTLVYTHNYIQPLRALYLDEIDASLHPSMIESMLAILGERSGDTRIFLATHSPSTVALAPEESLFFVIDGQAQKICRTRAIEELTQGFFTTEGISTIFRAINGVDKNVIVISEGKNVDYLVPILKKLGYANRIHVHQWTNSGGKGAGSLKPLMALFAEMITSAPFNKKVVFLFDCDVDPTIFAKNTQYVFSLVLPKQASETHPVQRGIENLIPKKTLNALGGDVYRQKAGECAIKDEQKESVAQHFLSELEKGNIELDPMRIALKSLLDLCE